MLNIILGVCLLCLGIYGVVANWWAVVDLIGVVIPVVLVVIGVLSIFSGISARGAARSRG
jgi:hypothetical protein